jgi:transposase-like protein
MRVLLEEEFEAWPARRKSALVLEVIQGKTTIAEASRHFDLTPAEIESWLEDGESGMENAIEARSENVGE